jgi:hypothetical protein
MSDAQFDDVEGTPDLVPRAHIRDLEAKAKRTDELEAELAKTKNDAAFTQALGENSHPGLSYFRDGYKGEMTSEAIRQAAVTAGFLAAESQTAPPAPPAGASADDLAAHARMAAASAGADGASGPVSLEAAIAATRNEAELTALLNSPEALKAGLRHFHQNQ